MTIIWRIAKETQITEGKINDKQVSHTHTPSVERLDDSSDPLASVSRAAETTDEIYFLHLDSLYLGTKELKQSLLRRQVNGIQRSLGRTGHMTQQIIHTLGSYILRRYMKRCYELHGQRNKTNIYHMKQ